MSHDDLRDLFRQRCKELGQSTVAKAIGFHPSTISQILSGTYPADDAAVLERFREVFAGISVLCPILGEISLDKCGFHRRREFAATNPVRVQLFRMCPACKVWREGGKP